MEQSTKRHEGVGEGGRGQKSPKTEARVFGTAPYVFHGLDLLRIRSNIQLPENYMISCQTFQGLNLLRIELRI